MGKMPPLPPLASTAGELARTEPAHQRRIKHADKVLDMLGDFEAMDVALRVVIPKARRKAGRA
jgi:hypothetical protein